MKFIYKGLLSIQDEFLSLKTHSLYFYKPLVSNIHFFSQFEKKRKLTSYFEMQKIYELSYKYKKNDSPLVLDYFYNNTNYNFSLKKNISKLSKNYQSSYYLNSSSYNHYYPIYNLIDNKMDKIHKSFYDLQLVFLDLSFNSNISNQKKLFENEIKLVKSKDENKNTFKFHFKIENNSNRDLETLLYRISPRFFQKFPILLEVKDPYLFAHDFNFKFENLNHFFKPLISLGLREMFDERKPRRGSVLWNELKFWFPNFEKEIKDKLKLRDFNFDEISFLISQTNFYFNLESKQKRYLNNCYLLYHFKKENNIDFIPFKDKKMFRSFNQKFKYSKSLLKLIQKQKKRLFDKTNNNSCRPLLLTEAQKKKKINFYGKVKFLPENQLVQSNSYNYFCFEKNENKKFSNKSIYRYPFDFLKEYQIFRTLWRQYERKLVYSSSFQNRFYLDKQGVYKIHKNYSINNIDNSNLFLILTRLDSLLYYFSFSRVFVNLVKKKDNKKCDFLNLNSGSGFAVDELFIKYKLSSDSVKNLRRKNFCFDNKFLFLNSDLSILKNEVLYDYSRFLDKCDSEKKHFDKSLKKNLEEIEKSKNLFDFFKTKSVRDKDNYI